MKSFKSFIAVWVLLLGLLLGLINSAQAQFDYFAAPRTIVLAPPRILDASAAVFTNGPIDVGGMAGTAAIDITTVTNSGGALTATLYMSMDQTNIVAVTNFALIKAATSYTYTNLYYGGTNVFATNQWLLPGTITAANASSGFVGNYLTNSTPFTNAAAITVTAKGVYRVGVRAPDLLRYLYIVWTPTGSSSNDIVAATFTGTLNDEVKVGK